MIEKLTEFEQRFSNNAEDFDSIMRDLLLFIHEQNNNLAELNKKYKNLLIEQNQGKEATQCL